MGDRKVSVYKNRKKDKQNRILNLNSDSVISETAIKTPVFSHKKPGVRYIKTGISSHELRMIPAVFYKIDGMKQLSAPSLPQSSDGISIDPWNANRCIGARF